MDPLTKRARELLDLLGVPFLRNLRPPTTLDDLVNLLCLPGT